MVLKADSAYLNGRKPFFAPDWAGSIEATPVLVMRVGRLGRSVPERFAGRYIDAIALGLDLCAPERFAGSAVEACSIEGSLPTGSWLPADTGLKQIRFMLGDEPLTLRLPEALPGYVVAEVSRVMTIRQGDLLFCPLTAAPVAVRAEDTLTGLVNQTETLYCKIK